MNYEASRIQVLTEKIAKQMDLISAGPGGIEEVMEILFAHARVLGLTLGVTTSEEKDLQEILWRLNKLMYREAIVAMKAREGGR